MQAGKLSSIALILLSIAFITQAELFVNDTQEPVVIKITDLAGKELLFKFRLESKASEVLGLSFYENTGIAVSVELEKDQTRCDACGMPHERPDKCPCSKPKPNQDESKCSACSTTIKDSKCSCGKPKLKSLVNLKVVASAMDTENIFMIKTGYGQSSSLSLSVTNPLKGK